MSFAVTSAERQTELITMSDFNLKPLWPVQLK